MLDKRHGTGQEVEARNVEHILGYKERLFLLLL